MSYAELTDYVLGALSERGLNALHGILTRYGDAQQAEDENLLSALLAHSEPPTPAALPLHMDPRGRARRGSRRKRKRDALGVEPVPQGLPLMWSKVIELVDLDCPAESVKMTGVLQQILENTQSMMLHFGTTKISEVNFSTAK